MLPALEGAEPIASLCRPAARRARGVQLRDRAVAGLPGLINVAAIRSTGLTASLGIAEHVPRAGRASGVELGPERACRAGPRRAAGEPWWRRAARLAGAG